MSLGGNKTQRNYKRVKVTACMWVGANSEQKIKKDQKTQLPLLRSLEQKLGTPQHRCSQLHKGVGKPPKLPLQFHPWTHSYLHFIKETSLHPSQGTSKQENLLFVLTSHCCSRGLSKALSEFLVWPLVNFYCLGKAKTSGWYHNQHSIGDYNSPLSSWLFPKLEFLWMWYKVMDSEWWHRFEDWPNGCCKKF